MYAAIVTQLWIIIIIQWLFYTLFYFLCTLDCRKRYLISQEPQLWSCRIWQGLLRAECEDRILLPPQVWEFSSSLVEPWVVRMPQSNLMKRSWSLCVSIMLIMKILRHIQLHMTKHNSATSKTRAMNGSSVKRER